jgi:hypothetical protein
MGSASKTLGPHALNQYSLSKSCLKQSHKKKLHEQQIMKIYDGTNNGVVINNTNIEPNEPKF